MIERKTKWAPTGNATKKILSTSLWVVFSNKREETREGTREAPNHQRTAEINADDKGIQACAGVAGRGKSVGWKKGERCHSYARAYRGTTRLE